MWYVFYMGIMIGSTTHCIISLAEFQIWSLASIDLLRLLLRLIVQIIGAGCPAQAT